ncbi:RNA-directed DNA polymerase, eukaryota, reverse transcriptase zinc-binding domain protein [Tanacetum coccineum]
MVSHCQSAFIPGRQITDNILLTKELLRCLNWKNGARRVALKIDIQKAYDTVNWDFLKRVLIMFKFPDKMIRWIMVCVKTVAFTINVNGVRAGYFKGGRGLSEDVKFKYHWDLQFCHPCKFTGVFMLPKFVVNDINKLLKGFLWCQGKLLQGKAKIAWKQVCNPKDEAGLGIKNLTLWNEVLIAKNLINVATMKESLWVKWIHEVRLKGNSIWEIECDNNSSHGWKQILSLRDKLRKHVVCRVGDRSKIFLWHDKWWGPKLLIKSIPMETIRQARLESNVKLKDMIKNGLWKWPMEWNSTFRYNLPNFVPKLIEG